MVRPSTTSAKVERALFLGHARVEDDLKQKVAELVLEPYEVIARDRVRHLIRFLECVWRNRPEILLEIPWAPRAWRTQRRHDLKQAQNVA